MTSKKVFRCVVFFILAVTLTTAGFAKKKTNESAWTAKPVLIDGQGKDWQDVTPLLKKKMAIECAFKNDKNYLYILFTFKDFKFLSTLNSSGMTVWLNSEGKKKKKYGIKFLRRVITADHFIALLERQHGPLPDSKKAEIKKKKAYPIYQNGVVNKDSDTVVPIKVASAQAPAFKVAQSREQVAYEFRIPLANVEGEVVGIGTTPGRDIMLAFEWGGMTKEVKERMKNRGRSTSASSYKDGVSSSMPGSEEGEGVGGGGVSTRAEARAQYARSRTPKKYSFYVPLKLAEEK
ncbi:MAG: hypothetical protein KAW12_05940 [Candidatus Aminicenantes bacterium]|nr:hypothetical protein [Candidatus Aminicenantes bacterium]